MTPLATSRAADLLWVILPYLAITTFVVGHIWRWRRDQFTWTSRSTQLLESKLLKLGGPLFHLGLLMVVGGHVLGILVPQSFTDWVGVSEHLYHLVSVTMGTIAGIVMVSGLAILIARRLMNKRVAATTRAWDVAVMLLLVLMAVTGMWNTVVENLINGGYNYRETVSPWFRGLFLLNPEPGLMTEGSIPLSYQLHAIGGWLLIMVWPFTRLVHAWSVPVTYVLRRPIVYRARAPRNVRAGVHGVGGRHPLTEGVPDVND